MGSMMSKRGPHVTCDHHDVLQVMYEAGAGGAPLAAAHMNSLDCELVPVLHAGALPPHLVLELVFHILDH